MPDLHIPRHSERFQLIHRVLGYQQFKLAAVLHFIPCQHMAVQSDKIQLSAACLQTHGGHYRIGALRRHCIGYTLYGFQKHIRLNRQFAALFLGGRYRKLSRIQCLILVFNLVSLNCHDMIGGNGDLHLPVRQIIDQIERPFRNDEGFPLCALYLRLNGHFHVVGD